MSRRVVFVVTLAGIYAGLAYCVVLAMVNR
jgi:hypothetical protein